MTSIIFSNNSPENLEYFLQSAKDNEINYSWCVLYNSDNEELKNKYKAVFEKYNIQDSKLIENFKEDLLGTITTTPGLVSFFKDTNHFFSRIPDINLEEIMADDNIFCFSLILGRNIKHCYYNDVYNILLNEEVIGENSMKWNWTKHYLDFGRPLELGGGHIFHKKEIHKIFKRWDFNDIMELESSFDKLDYFPKEMMASFNSSVLIDVNNINNEREKLNSLDASQIDRIVIEI